VDREVERAVQALEKELERGGEGLPGALRDALPRIHSCRGSGPARPRVGIVGEIYVRSDPFINQDLVRTIERLGGEAVLASLAEWVLYTDFLKRHGIGPDRPSLAERIAAPIRERFLSAKEELYYRIAEPYLGGRREPPVERVLEAGHPYVPLEFQGEAILTIGRAVLMAREESCEMIVSASPTFCMPGTITAAIFPKVEQDLGIPVLALSYDGSGDTNRVLVPHLHYLVERAARRQAGAGPGSSLGRV
jgi:predicted nucleotide-binding protein (sugar kinase/HSP70/actin superfamily)